jgi:hypothetical protein
MVLSMPRHTNVGSSSFGAPDALHPVQRFEGNIARLTNLLVVCHLLSGESYDDLLSTDQRYCVLLTCIQPGAFHFSVHSRVIDGWMQLHPDKTRFQALTELLAGDVDRIREPVGLVAHVPLDAILIRGWQLSYQLYNGALQGSLDSVPHPHDDPLACNW